MANLLVIDDDQAVLQVFQRILGEEHRVITAATAREGLEKIRTANPDVIFLDVMLPDESGLEVFERIHKENPRAPILVISASEESDVPIEAMKLGAFDYLLKPLDFTQVREMAAKALDVRRFMNVPVSLPDALEETPSPTSDMLVARCPAMQEVYKAIGRVAPQNATVLIRGESGAGKELIARAIFQHSLRRDGKFLAVNCAAIPESLLESELFGHEKGAFTGADSRKIGKFEQCSGGTLFLDEIGDMTPLSQSKILRVLQEQSFERVGGRETIRTDVRIIAATNRDLETMVENGQFRADLFYRLNGFTIHLPALRERGGDIMPLVKHYLSIFSREMGKNVNDVSPEAQEILVNYRWPGNVRQLQSVLRQAILHSTGSVLLPDFLPREVFLDDQAPAPGVAPTTGATSGVEAFIDQQLATGSPTGLYAASVEHLEQTLLTRVLRHTGGNQSQASKILGITRGSLRNKLRLLHISINPVVSIDDETGDEAGRSAADNGGAPFRRPHAPAVPARQG